MASECQRLLSRPSPQFHARADAIAYAVHATFVTNGFRLVGLDDDLSAPDRDFEGLPGQWNASHDAYTFRYRSGSSLVVVKAVVMGDVVLVHASRQGSTDVHTVELHIDDYVAPDTDLSSSPYVDLNALTDIVHERIVANVAPTPAAAAPAVPIRPPMFEDFGPDYPAPYGPMGGPVGGDFDDDMMGGPRFPPMRPAGGGGSLMGPDHPMFGRVPGRPGRGRLGPRFDPFGPDRGFSGE